MLFYVVILPTYPFFHGFLPYYLLAVVALAKPLLHLSLSSLSRSLWWGAWVFTSSVLVSSMFSLPSSILHCHSYYSPIFVCRVEKIRRFSSTISLHSSISSVAGISSIYLLCGAGIILSLCGASVRPEHGSQNYCFTIAFHSPPLICNFR